MLKQLHKYGKYVLRTKGLNFAFSNGVILVTGIQNDTVDIVASSMKVRKLKCNYC